MIRRQVVTNKTDAVVAVVVTDAMGYINGGLLTSNPPVPQFVGEIRIRLGVGREQWDSHYEHRTAGGQVTKDAWIELGTIRLKYISVTVGGSTFYRLPRLTDDVYIEDLPTGVFTCFKIKVPRGTFDVTGTMKVAICDMTYDANEAVFEGHTQEIWSKFGETNIVISEI